MTAKLLHPPQSEPAPVAEPASALPPLVRALLQPSAYPHPADHLELRETHLSWVLLAGPYVYKLKKPVNFGFLDFSTLEHRVADCADEVRLNRRLCPDVYLGIACVVRHADGFRIETASECLEPRCPGQPSPTSRPDHAGGGVARVEPPGTVPTPRTTQAASVGHSDTCVEPAVWMRRLPDAGMLPHLLRTGAADAALMRRIARRLARFHASAATGPGVDDFGTPDMLWTNWEENFAQSAPYLGRTVSSGTYHAILSYVLRFLADQDDLLWGRVAEGRVREGHGDLHAESICVEGSRLHLFDCLEFNPRFRCADVAAEVAFLAMDLDHFGRPDLSAAFVEAYVQASGDQQLLTLLDFYRCYRAYVRGKVRSFRLDQPGLIPGETERIAAQARAYFALALHYTAAQAEPPLRVALPLPVLFPRPLGEGQGEGSASPLPVGEGQGEGVPRAGAGVQAEGVPRAGNVLKAEGVPDNPAHARRKALRPSPRLPISPSPRPSAVGGRRSVSLKGVPS
jgi:aminoglycoside phosphotransferase family enzyme